jgi:nucleotide-binding universal stress UspA family protein
LEYDGEPEARKALNFARSLARASGAQLRVEGSPADLLLARSEGVDLLMIGPPRPGPAEAVDARSAAEMLLDGARCPVVVVPD